MTTTTRYRVSEGASDRIPKEKEEENRSESPGIDIADQMVEKAKGLAMKIIILHQECDDICHARRRRSVGVGVGVGVDLTLTRNRGTLKRSLHWHRDHDFALKS